MAEEVQVDPELQSELNELEEKINPASSEEMNGGGDENSIIEKDGWPGIRSTPKRLSELFIGTIFSEIVESPSSIGLKTSLIVVVVPSAESEK